MKGFTEEEMMYLKKYENNFTTAIKANYTRNVPSRDIDKMVEIYNRVMGTSMKICSYCTSSVLNFLKDMGNAYFKAVTERSDVAKRKNSVGTVQSGNETVLSDRELEKTVTMTECNEGTVTEANTKNNDVVAEQRKNNTTTKTKRNAKHTTKQSK